jgi:vacuolar-type H+-ATPase subunit E/Vma4
MYKNDVKQKAKELLKTHNQKETAIILGINERTMGVWAKKFREEEITEKKERNLLMDYLRCVIVEMRELRKQISKFKNK